MGCVALRIFPLRIFPLRRRPPGPTPRGHGFRSPSPPAPLLALCLWLCAAAPAAAATAVVVRIDKSDQRMTVSVNGMESYRWPVSTARRGYATPSGAFRPERMYVRYFSRKYDNSPMPHAIFYDGGFAIHGSYATGQLGRPASHGCVRLAPANAATLFSLVQAYGPQNTLILVTP